MGPVVYRREIGELAGEFLADYETKRLRVRLAPEEREEYVQSRQIYRDFVDSTTGSPLAVAVAGPAF